MSVRVRVISEIAAKEGIVPIFRDPTAGTGVKDTSVEDSQRFQEYHSNKSAYTPIAKECLPPGARVPFSIYALRGQSLITVCSATLTHPGFVRNGIFQDKDELFIEAVDIRKYTSHLSTVLEDCDTAGPVRMAVLKEKSKVVMKDVFGKAFNTREIKAAIKISDDIIECILLRDDVLSELLAIKQYDYQSYVHSIDVAVLSLSLGKILGLDRPQLKQLGIAGFLHDIGKRELPDRLLSRVGLLTDTEYAIYKRHVLAGVKALESTMKIPSVSISAIAQHHERLNGTGYPNGVADNEMDLFARILSITDCFDNLTSRRPNKPTLTPFSAVNLLVGEKGRFDQHILATFVKMLGKSQEVTTGV